MGHPSLGHLRTASTKSASGDFYLGIGYCEIAVNTSRFNTWSSSPLQHPALQKLCDRSFGTSLKDCGALGSAA
jgi:hypothetical protein